MLSLALAPHQIFSQNTVQVKTLTTDDGLNFRHVNTITQDQKGFMWFGTPQGITKYDGNIFKVFNNSRTNPNIIPNEDIMRFKYQSSTHTLWYIANHKLFALDLQTETLLPIQGINESLDGEVLDMALDHTNNLWVVNDSPNSVQNKAQQLIKYDGEAFHFIKSLERKSAGLTSLSITKNNEVCWATVNHGLSLFDQNGKVLSQKIIETYDYYGHTIHFARSFFDSNNQHYYFSESKGGVDLYKDFEFSQRLVDDNAMIQQAVEDHTNGIWFIGKKKVFYLTPDGELADYSKPINKSLKSSNITCAFVDQSNLLWLGTDNGILKVKLQPKRFAKILHFKDQEWGLSFRSIFALNNGDIIAMCETKNQLFRLSYNGTVEAISLPNSHNLLKDARYFTVEPQKDIAYTVTNDLIEIDFNTNEVKLYDAISPYLNETKPNPIIRLKDGSLVTGFTIFNLIRLDAKTKTFSRILNTKPEEDFIIKTLIQSERDNDILWVGTESKGLFKINLEGEILKHYHIGSTPALSNNSTLSLLELEDQLLIGTFGGGINLLNLREDKIKIIDKQTGLCDNNVVSILPVEDHVVIAATYNGLSRINLNGLEIQNFFEKDGISDNEFNYTSAFRSNDGQFYFGGLNGITNFSVGSLPSKKELPSLNFTHLEFYNQSKDTLVEHNQLSEASIVLSPYDINLKVDWSVPDYFNKEDYNYYTILEGFEKDWFYKGNTSSVRYNQLPAGDYVLKIRGVDVNGNKSKAGLEIPIVVHQIFYKTWWFITMMLFAVGAVIYGVFKYRLNQALAIERLRTRISSELHDDVGSMLTGIAMQTEMLEMQVKSESDKKKLKRLTHLSRNTIARMRDFVWTIDSRKDKLENLVERMHEYAEEHLLPSGIHYEIQTDRHGLSKKLNPNCRRNLYLIFKEAITNILKHSNAKNVVISISTRKGSCKFSIQDNGNKAVKTSTGQGLANMKMRSEEINAQLQINTVNGFSIDVILPRTMPMN